MFKEDLFDLFVQYEALPSSEKSEFLSKLKEHNPVKAQQLLLLSQDNQNFTQQFLAQFNDYSEQLSSTNIKLGDKFGVFTLIEPLGVGGMGHVYLAKRNDGLIEQKVAIKFLHPALYKLNSTQTLLNEAQALANLNHPNIATIFDVAKTDEGLVYMVMEYIEGRTLEDYLNSKKISLNEKLKLFLLIADAIQEAHSKRIIHADIKPTNILITDNGQPKLIDFGIMQFIGSRAEKPSTFINQYLCAMTVNYASPEQLKGLQGSIQSDVYALGGLLFFMLSGQTPFDDIAVKEKINAVLNNSVPNCAIKDKAKFKSDIDWILQTCLAKQPEDRFRSVGALIAEVDNYLNHLPLSRINSLGYRFNKSWHRNKTGYMLNIFVIALLTSFATKTWYDNTQIQQSYKELSSSYLKQYTTINEIKEQETEITLPSPDSIPIELYIQLAFQKYEQNLTVDETKARAKETISNLKQVLHEREFKDEKLMALVEFREKQSKVKYADEEDIQQFKNEFLSLLDRNDLTHEEIIDILFISMRFSAVDPYTYNDVLDSLNKTLIIEVLPVISQIKYLVVKANHYGGGITATDINPLELSQNALLLAENHSKEISSFLYLEVLNSNQMLLSNIMGLNLEYYAFLKKANEFLSKVNFANNNVTVGYLKGDIEGAEKYNSISDHTPLNRKHYSKLNSITLLENDASYFGRIGEYEKATELYQYVLKKITKLYGERGHGGLYNLVFLSALNLKKGKIEETLDFIENRLMPELNETYTDDWKASYLLKFCIPLSYHMNKEDLEPYCKEPYFINKSVLGEANFWTEETLITLVWWYSLQPVHESEHFYVKRLESLVSESMNYFKIRQSQSLAFYYISRNNPQKAYYYLDILDSTIDEYAGDKYVISIDRSKTLRAEVKLLERHKQEAKELLKEASQRICQYEPKNYHRIHLERVAQKAGINEYCLST